MLKDILYTGLGGVATLKEHIDHELDRLKEKGKRSAEDADDFMHRLKTRGEEEETAIKTHLTSAIKSVIEELDIATKSDLDALKDTLK